MKLTLFTDLDNTLIHSHRHRLTEPGSCVELLNGRRQSFALDALVSYLRDGDWLDIVPVTMRTFEQYSRLGPLIEALGLSRALICSGAILLDRLAFDGSWLEESRRLAGRSRGALARLREASPAGSVVSVDPFMFYIKTDRPGEVLDELREKADPGSVLLYRDSGKVYCLASAFSKGTAVERFGGRPCIAVGDSEPDIPMLNAADYAVCPDALYDRVRPRQRKYRCSLGSSDQVIRALNSIRKEVF